MKPKDTVPTRIDKEQRRIISDASESMDVSFQYLLRRAIKIGIKMMRLEERINK